MLLDDAASLDHAEFRLKYPSVATFKKDRLSKLLQEMKGAQRSILSRDTLAPMSSKRMQEAVIEIMEKDVKPALAGEVDEPVTADIKRLIRLPGSLHGKSGLRVIPLSRDELTSFDPLRDAVPDQFDDEPITVTMKNDADVVLRGQRFRLSGPETVPEYLAVFLIGRKMADIGHLPD